MGSSRALRHHRRDSILLLVGVLILMHATAVLAHTTSTGLAALTVTGSTLTYRLTLVLSELPDEPARLFTAAAAGDAGSVERMAALLRQSVHVRTSERLCRPGRTTLQGSRLGDVRITLALTLHCSDTPAQLIIRDDWFDVLGEHYRTLARIEGPGGVHQVAFLPDAREAMVTVSAERSQHDTSFFWLGVEHIVTGYDHLLFLG